ATVEVHRPDGGWLRLGTLRPGYSELAAGGTAADSIRLTWDGSRPLAVNEIVPWYADAPAARLELDRPSLDVIGGRPPATAEATVEATGAEGSTGALAVRLPSGAKGLTVSAPSSLSVPRGGRLAAPLRIAATASTPPGTYAVRVSFTTAGRT